MECLLFRFVVCLISLLVSYADHIDYVDSRLIVVKRHAHGFSCVKWIFQTAKKILAAHERIRSKIVTSSFITCHFLGSVQRPSYIGAWSSNWRIYPFMTMHSTFFFEQVWSVGFLRAKLQLSPKRRNWPLNTFPSLVRVLTSRNRGEASRTTGSIGVEDDEGAGWAA